MARGVPAGHSDRSEIPRARGRCRARQRTYETGDLIIMSTANPATITPASHDGLAWAALVCGFLFGPLAIVFGHASNREAYRAGRDRSVLAMSGLVLGYIWADIVTTVILLLIVHSVAALFLPAVCLFIGNRVLARKRARKG
jgi:hypothetical protein